jgi:hypothetical protein
MRAQTHRLAGLVVGAGILAMACGSPVAPSPLSTAAASSAPPSAPPSEVLTRWVSPESMATVTSYHLTLSATAPSSSVRQIGFHARESGVDNTLCVADVPGPGDVWSCDADLVADDIVPGALRITFDTVSTFGAGTIASDAGGPRAITFAAPPPRPTDTTFDLLSESSDPATETDTMVFVGSWSLPEGYADRIRVYGVTNCVRESALTNEQPCVLDDTLIPPSSLQLLGTIPGTANSFKVTERSQGVGPGPWSAIVVQASNANGTSPFGILNSSAVCWQCVY